MFIVSDELSEYISQITLDFTEYTRGVRRLFNIEETRQKKIKLKILLLIKLYKGMKLSGKEKEILSKHIFQYDYKTDLSRCIYQIAYEISERVSEKTKNIQKKNWCKYSMYTNSIYRKYLNALEKYKNSLLNAMCFNREIILIDPSNNETIYPVMDFDSNCFMGKKNNFIKRRTLN